MSDSRNNANPGMSCGGSAVLADRVAATRIFAGLIFASLIFGGSMAVAQEVPVAPLPEPEMPEAAASQPDSEGEIQPEIDLENPFGLAIEAQPEDQPPPAATGAPVSIVPALQKPGPYLVPPPADEVAMPGATDTVQTDAEDGSAGIGISEFEVIDGEDAVAVVPLETIDPATVGLLDQQNGGFGADMWAGTSRSLVERLLPRLPAEVSSPVLQSLRRRLLLSAASVPQGEASGPGLLGLRLERLSAAGDLPGLVGILERIGPEVRDDVVSRARADVLLLSGDLAGACGEARAGVRRSDEAYWLKVSAFCRLLDGDSAGASLAIELLIEEDVDDPLFFMLMEHLMAGQAEATAEPLEIGTLVTLSPLDLGMLRASRQAVPLGAIVSAPALILRAIAASPGTPVNTRLQAADAAAGIGAVDGAVLSGIFAAFDFTEGERDNALVIAEADVGAKADALLFQMALEKSDPQEQARMLNAAGRLARRTGNYPLMARVNLAAAKAISPSPELIWSAAEISRLLLLAGEIDRVFEWYRVVRARAAEGDLDATKALLDMWPLFQIADPAGTLPWSEQILGLWWQGQSVLPAQERLERGRLLFALLEGLGQEIPGDFWAQLLDGPLAEAAGTPNMAVWRGMVAAAGHGRRAETVLLVLLALADDGITKASPTVLGSAVASLRAVGLEADARALALEAAVVRGL
ncbi:MAG: hypothetical protein ACE5EM_03640 [Sphingomonadales bacterium]